jgi:MYXO-CTERM domain-containing protein
MRAVLVSLLALPTIASAAPRSNDWDDTVIDRRTDPAGPAALTNVSHTLYLNNCLPNGCTVNPSNSTNSSITNTSSIARPTNGIRNLTAWRWGDARWNDVVECVRATFAPFDIDVITTDPGNANHHEVMVAGTAVELRPNLEAGGIAPFIACGASEENTLTFVFASQTNDIQYLCGAIAHEAGHAWGLTHSLDADDPMTYLDLGSLKRFQNRASQCGEQLSNPYPCECTGNTQNGFDYLRDTFGLNPNLEPMSVTLERPSDGAYVRPGFPISAVMTSGLEMLRGELEIDGEVVEQFETTPFLIWNAPEDLSPGEHTVTIRITDLADRTGTATATVRVVQACNGGSCPSGLTCISDLCVPGADQDGGLGATCDGNDDCITGTCASDGTTSLCTGQCGAGGTCPDNYTCITAANTCWPAESGGCASSGNGAAPTFFLIMLGGLFLMRRSR